MKIRLTIGKLMIEIESESEEVIIEREVVADPQQTTLDAFKRPNKLVIEGQEEWVQKLKENTAKKTVGFRGRPLGAKDLQKREPSHCSTCGAPHRKAQSRRAGADGRPHDRDWET